jgi:hypothetical protein
LNDQLVSSLADRLVSSKLIDDTLGHLPFHERIAMLCASCPDQLPSLYRAELHDVPAMFPLLCHKGVLQAAQKVLASATSIRIYPNYSVRPKTSHGVHEVTWHQDAGLRGDGGPSTIPMEQRLDAFGIGCVVNCWTCLGKEANVQNGCMRFVPGSQRMGVLTHVPLASYKGGTTVPLAERGEVLGKGVGGATTQPPGEHTSAVLLCILHLHAWNIPSMQHPFIARLSLQGHT